jgi:hypothetical protein
MAYGKNNTKKAPQRETTPPALIAWHVSERGEKKVLEPHRRGLGARGRRGPDPATRPAPGHRRPHRSPQTERG